MRYQEVRPIAREDAEAILRSGTVDDICDAIVREAFFDPGWEWVEARCLELARDDRTPLRQIAATCLGHLARIHGTLHHDLVLPVLQSMLLDAQTAGQAEDALSDIQQFAPVQD